MSTGLRSARGASVFTYADRSSFDTPGKTSVPFTRAGDTLEQAWDCLIDDLLRIRNVKDDWDGEGSEAPHPFLVDSAIALALALKGRCSPPADRVIASVNGTVYFEWHFPSGYQEVEVTSPLDAQCRWVAQGSDKTVVVDL
jgi:hypothetical protein